MSDRKLIDYLPPVLQEILELRAIAEAQQPEMDAAWDAVDTVLNNQFVSTATEEGIRRWERQLALMPDADDTPEKRRSRILAYLKSDTPYTKAWLKAWASSVSNADCPEPTIDGYVLTLCLPLSADYEGLMRAAQKKVPAAIQTKMVGICKKQKKTYYTGAVCRNSIIHTVQTENLQTGSVRVLMDGESNILADETGRILYEEVS